jgi:hypothetical protein
LCRCSMLRFLLVFCFVLCGLLPAEGKHGQSVGVGFTRNVGFQSDGGGWVDGRAVVSVLDGTVKDALKEAYTEYDIGNYLYWNGGDADAYVQHQNRGPSYVVSSMMIGGIAKLTGKAVQAAKASTIERLATAGTKTSGSGGAANTANQGKGVVGVVEKGMFNSKPSVPTIGPKPSKMGEILKFGTGSDVPRQQIGTLSKEYLQEAGITREVAKEWRDVYQWQVQNMPKNGSAAGRLDLMNHILEVLK